VVANQAMNAVLNGTFGSALKSGKPAFFYSYGVIGIADVEYIG